jgi:hypothetical protein
MGDPRCGPRFGHCELVIGGCNVGTVSHPHTPSCIDLLAENASSCKIQRCGVYEKPAGATGAATTVYNIIIILYRWLFGKDKVTETVLLCSR